MPTRPKIIVLDDDPTGSQTVHSCLLLLKWDADTLKAGVNDPSPIVFILTNTRANPPDRAAEITRTVCQNLKKALAAAEIQDFLIVSRSDSTLRGHYPLETDIIAQELGPFDAHFLVPAFLEGGRITKDSIHYVLTDEEAIPVHQTEFAQDAVFGFHHSYLPDYVAEKTQGQIPAHQVARFLTPADHEQRLSTLMDNQCVVVDAQIQADLDRFAQQVLRATGEGKRFLFRSAASLLTALAQLPPQPVPGAQMGQYRRSEQPGLFVVGSYVQKTTAQLTHLLQQPNTVGIEVALERLQGSPTQTCVDEWIRQILKQIKAAHRQRQTPVVFTSREELRFPDVETRLRFGQVVSELLTKVVRHVAADLGYLVSKGGNTSSAILTQGLGLQQVRLLGQVVPGCCVVQTAAKHRYPKLPVVLCPGNVGAIATLTTIHQHLEQ